MTNRPPTNDPKRIWQNQNPENPIMSLHDIREKLRQLETTKRVVMSLGLAGFLGFGMFFCVLVVRNYEQGRLFGAAYTGFIALTQIYMAYICLRGLFSKRLAPDAGRKTAIESFRAFYQWKRGLLLRLLAVHCVIWIMIAVGAGRLSTRRPAFAAELGAACVLAGILTYFKFRWMARRLQSEFDSLDALGKDDGNVG